MNREAIAEQVWQELEQNLRCNELTIGLLEPRKIWEALISARVELAERFDKLATEVEECILPNGHEGHCEFAKCAGSPDMVWDRLALLEQQETKLKSDLAASEQRVKEMREALPRWIPVEERLPEDGVRTFCAFTTHAGAQLHMHILIYRDGHFRGADAQPRSVTHWMPLPSAPGARAVRSEE